MVRNKRRQISSHDAAFVLVVLNPFIARLRELGFTDIDHGWGYAPANAWHAGNKRYHVRATAPNLRYFTKTQENKHKNLRAYYTWFNGRWQGQYHTRLTERTD